MEAILSIIYSIIANLLTPYAQHFFPKWKLKIEEKNTSPELQEPKYHPDLTEAEKQRARKNNREKLARLAQQVFLFGFPAFILYAALRLTFEFKAFGKVGFSFGDTRLDWLFGDLQVGDKTITAIILILWLITYPYCFKAAQKLAFHIGGVLDQIWKVSPNQFITLTVLSFFPIALIVAGQLVFLLYPKFSYLQAIAAPFVVALIGGAFVLSQSQENNQQRV